MKKSIFCIIPTTDGNDTLENLGVEVVNNEKVLTYLLRQNCQEEFFKSSKTVKIIEQHTEEIGNLILFEHILNMLDQEKEENLLEIHNQDIIYAVHKLSHGKISSAKEEPAIHKKIQEKIKKYLKAGEDIATALFFLCQEPEPDPCIPNSYDVIISDAYDDEVEKDGIIKISEEGKKSIYFVSFSNCSQMEILKKEIEKFVVKNFFNFLPDTIIRMRLEEELELCSLPHEISLIQEIQQRKLVNLPMFPKVEIAVKKDFLDEIFLSEISNIAEYQKNLIPMELTHAIAESLDRKYDIDPRKILIISKRKK